MWRCDDAWHVSWRAPRSRGRGIDSGRVGAGGEIVTDEPRRFEDLLDIAVKHLEDDIKVFAAARGGRDNQIEDTIQVHFARFGIDAGTLAAI